MIRAESLPVFLSRLIDYAIAKFQLWVRRPINRILLTPIRMGVDFTIVILLGMRDASLSQNENLLDQDPIIYFLATGSRHNLTTFLLDVMGRTDGAEKLDPLQIVLFMVDDASPALYIQVARLSGRNLNIRSVFKNEENEWASEMFCTGSDQSIPARKDNPELSLAPRIATHKSRQLRMPLVHRNTGHAIGKFLDPRAKICFISSAGCDDANALLETTMDMARRNLHWRFFISDAIAGGKFVDRGLTPNIILLDSLGLGLLQKLSLISESDVFIGYDDIFTLCAIDNLIPTHFISVNAPHELSENSSSSNIEYYSSVENKDAFTLALEKALDTSPSGQK